MSLQQGQKRCIDRCISGRSSREAAGRNRLRARVEPDVTVSDVNREQSKCPSGKQGGTAH